MLRTSFIMMVICGCLFSGSVLAETSYPKGISDDAKKFFEDSNACQQQETVKKHMGKESVDDLSEEEKKEYIKKLTNAIKECMVGKGHTVKQP